ncbi:MAG: D-glycero-alpha-D-manno-heptose-1,7-bisphosphate 7-phosphatase [Bacteroidales bacterium]
MILPSFRIDKTWSLFLDRDGVINKRLPGGYVKEWEAFVFLPGVLEAMKIFSGIFGKIFIVTNQQGIGKGIMTEAELTRLHDRMLEEIRYEGGFIHKIYHSPYREEEKSIFRKPNPGMAKKAKIDFPEIDFKRSIMIGDSITDMEFGKNLGMITFLISDPVQPVTKEERESADMVFPGLLQVAELLTQPK